MPCRGWQSQRPDPMSSPPRMYPAARRPPPAGSPEGCLEIRQAQSVRAETVKDRADIERADTQGGEDERPPCRSDRASTSTLAAPVALNREQEDSAHHCRARQHSVVEQEFSLGPTWEGSALRARLDRVVEARLKSVAAMKRKSAVQGWVTQRRRGNRAA